MSVLKLDAGSYRGLHYEGATTREPSEERGSLSMPSDARAFAHSVTSPATSLAWPYVGTDISFDRAGPTRGARVYASDGNKEWIVAHGRGVLTDPANGSVVFSGDFHRGWFNGNGSGRILECNTPGVISFVGLYKGQWAYGYRHGSGELVNVDEGLFVGEWKFDRKHGKGKEIDASGAIYYGAWRDGVKHGVGKLSLPGLTEQCEYQQWDCGRLMFSHTLKDEQAKQLLAALITAVDKIASDLTKVAPLSQMEPSLPAIGESSSIATAGDAPVGPLKLNDKRVLKELQEQVVPRFQRDIKASVPVPFEVDWDSFTSSSSPATAVWMLAAHDQSWVLKPVQVSLTKVLDTESMKKEFAQMATKVVLRNKEKLHETFEVSLENKTLYISATFSAGASSRLYAEKLKQELDKKL